MLGIDHALSRRVRAEKAVVADIYNVLLVGVWASYSSRSSPLAIKKPAMASRNSPQAKMSHL